MNFETLLDALNDGRDRALRAWGVDMSWLLCVSRDNPRSGDDVARWATGAAARSGNVVAMELVGADDAQPIGQFHRAFATAHKKALPAIVDVSGEQDAGGIAEILEDLGPRRLINPWASLKDEQLLARLAEQGMPVLLSLSRAQRRGPFKNLSRFPLKSLLDSGVQVVLSSWHAITLPKHAEQRIPACA